MRRVTQCVRLAQEELTRNVKRVTQVITSKEQVHVKVSNALLTVSYAVLRKMLLSAPNVLQGII